MESTRITSKLSAVNTRVLFLLINMNKGKAQVENPAFNLMLKSLLSHSVNEINVQQADSLMKEEAVFVDARERNEHQVSAIHGAVWVGYDTLNLSLTDTLDKSKPIVVYCSVGYRSEKVAEKIRDRGFSRVYNLYGGIFEWINQGYPVYKSGGKTNQIHAYNRVWGIWLKKGEKVYH